MRRVRPRAAPRQCSHRDAGRDVKVGESAGGRRQLRCVTAEAREYSRELAAGPEGGFRARVFDAGRVTSGINHRQVPRKDRWCLLAFCFNLPSNALRQTPPYSWENRLRGDRPLRGGGAGVQPRAHAASVSPAQRFLPPLDSGNSLRCLICCLSTKRDLHP